MVYLFYGNNYAYVFKKAYEYSKNINSQLIIINESVMSYTKEDITLLISFFSVSADSVNQYVLIIEHIERIKLPVMQLFLSIFENLSPFHHVILVTDCIALLPKTIISRSMLFYESDTTKNKFDSFFSELLLWDTVSDIEAIIDRYAINEKNSIDASIELQKKYIHLKDKIHEVQKYFLPYIQNSYYCYWKQIYLILRG